MTSSAIPPPPAATPVAPTTRSRWPIRIAALTPLWLFLILELADNGFGTPMFSAPPSIVGVPLGVVVGALATGWMLIGLGLVWNARSRLTELLALLLFTTPATIVLVMGPAMILILQNLS